ncbi:MAG: tetratricopeptide repeat protein [Candidatus Omnitrophota bacterium]
MKISAKNKYKTCAKILAFVLVVLYYSCCHAQESDPIISAEETAQNVSLERSEEDKAYSELLEKYEDLKIDRENILIQTQKLLSSRREYERGIEALEGIKGERDEFLEKNKKLEKKVIAQEAELEVLKEEISQLETRKAELEVLTSDVKIKDMIKRLEIENNARIKAFQDQFSSDAGKFKDKITDLEQALKEESKTRISEKRILEKNISRLEKEIGVAQKREEKNKEVISSLRSDIEELETERREDKKTILGLEKETRRVPSDLRKISLHNQELTKQLADTHYNLGVYFCRQGEFRRAMEEYKQVLEIRPQDTDAMYNLAVIYAEHETDRDKAIELFERYITIDNKSTNAQWAKNYIMKWEAWRRESKDILR